MLRRVILLAASSGLAAWADSAFFEARIRPVLVNQCGACHSTATRTSGLALDSRRGVETGGKRGTLLVAGDPAASLLIRALEHRDPALKMPPSGKLPENTIADLREWVRQGAVYPEPAPPPSQPPGPKHWSFQPVKDAALPPVRNAAWVKSPVDRFLLARLESAGLRPSGPAAKLDLLRRVTFDLTGLPPSPRDVREFLADHSAGAYERVVDRLLASPHYGERWARHWFDLVRFAETNGHEFDFYKFEGWRYRDYVIRAFNQDLPYSRFLAEHIAGDLLPGPRLAPRGEHWDSPLGSGFFGLQEERNGATDLEEVRSEMRDSKIDVFGKAFLGLTIACARCHDHKFDPVTTADYYALGGIIDSTRTSLGSISSPAISARIEDIVAGIAAADGRPAPPPRASLPLRPGEQRFDSFDQWHVSGAAFAGGARSGARLDSSRLASNRLTGIMISRSFVPKHRYIHVRVAGSRYQPVREEPSQLAVTIFAAGRYPKGVAGEGDRRWRWKTITLKEEINQVCHLEIADRKRDGHLAVDAIVFSDLKEPPPNPEEAALPPVTPDNSSSTRARLEAELPEETFGLVSYEDSPHDMRIHTRGNHLAPGDETPRRFLAVLGGNSQPERYRQGSGRLALAEAMTSPANPLVARVMVNRIWKHHFGEGLNGTVDNFGLMGEKPSHPELLDWLAARFVESGWSVKAMHKLMLMSAAYRQAAAPPDAAARELDPRNRLLARMPVRRLDAESIRDAILTVSGALDPSVYGQSVTPHISPWQDGRGKPESGPLDGRGRRSVYLEVRRNFLLPLLLAFDFPLPTTTVGRRSVSSVPAQALAMMNSEFIARQAERWAKSMEAAYSDPRERLDAMYLAAFTRVPADAERERILADFVGRGGGSWTEVAHVLFNSKEFLFLK